MGMSLQQKFRKCQVSVESCLTSLEMKPLVEIEVFFFLVYLLPSSLFTGPKKLKFLIFY